LKNSENFLSEYIDKKVKEINEYNKKYNFDPNIIVNGRRLTNLGTFRAYIQAYLDNNPNIHKELIKMVRQLPPGEYGIPLEIYAFTSSTDWRTYENIQSDIFDHIIAVAPYFGLRLFQNPTGHDFRSGIKDSQKS
jgi:miniconductance mechanosensitive channel